MGNFAINKVLSSLLPLGPKGAVSNRLETVHPLCLPFIIKYSSPDPGATNGREFVFNKGIGIFLRFKKNYYEKASTHFIDRRSRVKQLQQKLDTCA
jgi:hypothetical protein